MKENLKVLIVEDSEDDYLLLIQHLKEGGFELKYNRVETEVEFRNQLSQSDWDLIIADYILPQFSGLAALEIIQSLHLNIPFILISGHVNEEIAVKSIELGAQDCIMKDNLVRLIPAIKRELRERDKHNNPEDNPTIKVDNQVFDDIDRQIINLLNQDGRMKLTYIGQQIDTENKQGYTHVGIKNRVQKLIDSKLVKIQANINLSKLEFVNALIMIQVDNTENCQDLFRKYQMCPRLLFFNKTSGKYNVQMVVIGENIKDLERFIDYCSPKDIQYVKDYVVYISTSIFFPEFFPLENYFNQDLYNQICNVTGKSCQFK